MLKNLLLLSGFSTFAVALIIALNIAHNNTISSLPEYTQTHAKPIPTGFDTKTLNNLKEREAIPYDLTVKSSVTSEDSEDASSITGSSQTASRSASPNSTSPTITPATPTTVSITPIISDNTSSQ